MEIKRVENDFEVEFKCITPGDVFLWDGEYYLRVYYSSGINKPNAVRLSDGQCSFLYGNETVSPVGNCYLSVY